MAAPVALGAIFGVGLRRTGDSGDQVSAANPWAIRLPLISSRISACQPLGSGATTSSTAAAVAWARRLGRRALSQAAVRQLEPARAEVRQRAPVSARLPERVRGRLRERVLVGVGARRRRRLPRHDGGLRRDEDRLSCLQTLRIDLGIGRDQRFYRDAVRNGDIPERVSRLHGIVVTDTGQG